MTAGEAGRREARVAWVVGGAGGLGGVVVGRLAGLGWRVAASWHERPVETGVGVGVGSDAVWWHRLDVTDSGQVREAGEEIRGRYGRLDGLVYCAGVTADAPMGKLTDAAWERVMGVNVRGAFLCAREVLSLMAAGGGGQVVNVGSWVGRHGGMGQVGYASAKAALVGFTLALAREGGPMGVGANVVCPGVLKTRMTAEQPAAVWEGWRAARVLGRTGAGSLEDVAGLIAALLAERGVTGQVFSWDARIGAWS
jgi:NAD(P)-dependent dehydrogenase (short-subunit alcohol dehydrogenase family)